MASSNDHQQGSAVFGYDLAVACGNGPTEQNAWEGRASALADLLFDLFQTEVEENGNGDGTVHESASSELGTAGA